MLSIGKMSAGRAGYYTAELPGGKDEYYTRGEAEAPAVWLGSAAERLGLSGPVDPEAFRRLLDADHPVTGERLGVPRTTDRRMPGFDVCLSAPKSVSVAWALAPPEVAEQIAAAHDRAVVAAIGVVETEVARARRGARAATVVETEGIVAAGFGHRTSRAGDPQMHTHVVIPNLTVTADGRWSALAGDRLYRWAKTVGYLYQSTLRAELTQSLGVEWGPVTKGSAELVAIPQVLAESFSTRRAEVRAALDAAGATSAHAAEIAALATRQAKDHHVDLGQLRRDWHARARELGIDPAALYPRLLGQAPTVVREVDVGPDLLGPGGLCANAATFDRRDVLQQIAARHGPGIDAADALDAAGRLLARADVVPLSAVGRREPRYTTMAQLEMEAALVAMAARRNTGRAGVVDPAVVERAIADRPSLSGEQAGMIRSLTGSGAGIEVVVGRAGSGKTFALDAARQAWTDSGHRVIGAALAARAAAELQAGSGIPSATVDRLLAELDQPGPFSPIPPRSVIVVDEAAMIGTRKLARLAGHAERVGAKLVLVGDHRQLPEIDAGGSFAALTRVVPTTELTVNRRQHESWERDALSELRSGSVHHAIDSYHRAGRLHLASTAEDAHRQLVSDWWAAHENGIPAAMYALRRWEVDDLNRRARHHMTAAGRLGDETLHAGGRDFSVGDEVVCLHNDRRLGVTNGTRSTVTFIDRHTRTVTLASGTVLPGEYLDVGWLDHGYATTIHKGQGATVGQAFVLGSDALYREAGYVGLSRARESNRLYLVAPDTGIEGGDPLADTIRRLGASRAQQTALEQLHPERPRSSELARSETAELAADPPSWLTDAIGVPPVTPDEREAWLRHAGRLAAYRDIYAIDDPASALGPVPVEREQRRAWELARTAIDEHDRNLEINQGRQR
jgi:conjugative relaxase-like TrwC/TraI family protein